MPPFPETQFETAHTWRRVDSACPEIHQEAWDKTAQFIGALSVGPNIRIETIEAMDSSSTLMHSAKQADQDKDSKAQVEKNVEKEIVERLFKAGRVSRTTLVHTPRGIEQDGRNLTDINANSLRFSSLEGEMKQRAAYEYKNSSVFEQLADAGLLEEYDALVCSLASADRNVIKNYGFSEKYLTASLQLMSKAGNEIILDTALVAGKKTEDSDRHDKKAISELAARHGMVLEIENPADLLDVVILIPKGELSNGVIDVVREYDDISGGTFFGEAKPRVDYSRYADEQKDQDFSAMVDRITKQLVAEAPFFEHPMQAIKRLSQLADFYTVGYAVQDKAIDIAIFGYESAILIQQAREYMKTGDTEQAEVLIEKAHEKSTNSSCPVFADRANANKGGDSDSSEKSERKWMNCPHCSAKVYDDPCAKVLACWDCKAMVVNGTVVSKGNGGRKRRQEEARKKLEVLKSKEMVGV